MKAFALTVVSLCIGVFLGLSIAGSRAPVTSAAPPNPFGWVTKVEVGQWGWRDVSWSLPWWSKKETPEPNPANLSAQGVEREEDSYVNLAVYSSSTARQGAGSVDFGAQMYGGDLAANDPTNILLDDVRTTPRLTPPRKTEPVKVFRAALGEHWEQRLPVFYTCVHLDGSIICY